MIFPQNTLKALKKAAVESRRLAWLPALVAALSLVSACGPQAEAPPPAPTPPPPAPEFADLVFVNGGIYTADASHSWAEAAAVRGGAIIAVGVNDDVKALTGPDTRVVDLSGKMLLPGFHDAHVHPGMGGMALLGCGLDGLSSVEAIVARIARVVVCLRMTLSSVVC